MLSLNSRNAIPTGKSFFCPSEIDTSAVLSNFFALVSISSLQSLGSADTGLDDFDDDQHACQDKIGTQR